MEDNCRVFFKTHMKQSEVLNTEYVENQFCSDKHLTIAMCLENAVAGKVSSNTVFSFIKTKVAF